MSPCSLSRFSTLYYLVVALSLGPGGLGLGDPGDGHAKVLDQELLPLCIVLAAAHPDVPAQGSTYLK